MSMQYQMESSHIADYGLWTLPGIDFPLRGPPVAIDGKAPAISFLGAAQVFGTFVNHPFPNLLGEMLSARVINLANGGAGPGLYANRPELIDLVNRSSACVIQVMSARSSMQNKYMTSLNGRASVRVTYPDGRAEDSLGHHALLKIGREISRQAFSDLVAETLDNYLAQYRMLCAAITVPKVLLYVGPNPPIADVTSDDWTPERLVGTHPHLVTQNVFAELQSLCDATVSVVGKEGMDKRLLNRFTGEHTSIKRSETYTITNHRAYIPPHMHVRTALELYPVVEPFLAP
ncbi:DUF6473 family protein [Psychromarinibacter halotolerans]|uniref:DUF6473 family protein n=1 Tax=Psychromarinibacter halotolerans TaxID=1775175 RepID=A0ABV7GU28_9RHOB|nr:DUF6473 family protein [Psychromarinibacter halotolerans]MDF0598659.1 DUF6473 family protein [Psychromarinibacter halotolerans]